METFFSTKVSGVFFDERSTALKNKYATKSAGKEIIILL